MKRVHTYSTSATENSLLDQFSVSLYGYTGERTGEGSIGTKHAMNFTLRPGEAMEWRFGHAGKEYSGAIPLKEGERWTTDGTGTLRQLAGENAYALMRNGKWIYRPPLDKAIWRKGIVAEENIAWDEAKGRIYAAKADKNASVTWQIASPYVLVGGKVRVQRACKEAGDLVDVAVAPDNEWKQTTEELSPDGPPFVNLDGFLSPQKKPTYKYDVMISLR